MTIIINSYKEQFARQRQKNKTKPKKRRIVKNFAIDPNFLTSFEWRKVRYEALIKYGRQCQCCGAKPPNAILHVDHIKPRKTHPELALMLSNLQILCHECNHGKGNWNFTDFR